MHVNNSWSKFTQEYGVFWFSRDVKAIGKKLCPKSLTTFPLHSTGNNRGRAVPLLFLVFEEQDQIVGKYIQGVRPFP